MFRENNEVRSHSVCFALLKKYYYSIRTQKAKVKSGERRITKLKYHRVYLHYLLYLKSLQFNALFKNKVKLSSVLLSSWHIHQQHLSYDLLFFYLSIANLLLKCISTKSTFALAEAVSGYENNIEIENVHHVLPLIM